MIALITGASSGIGRDISIYLSKLGYDLIVVARRKERLYDLKKICNTKVQIISTDLSKEENCFELYNIVKNQNIDILINNAGFGLFGNFNETNINKELEMININIKAVHILTKLFLKDMVQYNKGHIMNVSSSAAFAPGPLMTTYYSTKSYVFRLSNSIAEELKRQKSKVKISVLCPGPVDTEFNSIANVKFAFKPLTSKYVSKYAIDKMLKGKQIIIPGVSMKINSFFSKLIPEKILAKIIYYSQKRKIT